MKKYTLSILTGFAAPALLLAQDATEVPVQAQSGAEIQVRGEETSAEAKIRRLQKTEKKPVGETRGQQIQDVRAREERRDANAEKRAAVNNDTANPNSRPAKANPDTTKSNDTSDLANPAATPLQDSVERANPASMPVEDSRTTTPSVDTAQGLANPAATPADVNANTTPVTDRMPENANPEATANTANIEAKPRMTTAGPTTDANVTPADEAAAAAEARMPEQSPVTPRTTNAPAPPSDAVVAPTGAAMPEQTRAVPKTPNASTPANRTAVQIKSKSDARMAQEKAASNKSGNRSANANARANGNANANRKAPNERTNKVLQETRRDRQKDAAVAAKIEDDDDANTLIYSILGGAAAGVIATKVIGSDKRAQDRADAEAYRRGQRLPVAEVGRTQADRDQSVNYYVRRFEGDASMQDAPYYRDQRQAQYRQPVYYDNNRRVVRYATRSEIPPVLIASERLDRVDVVQAGQMNYRPAAQEAGRYYNEVPAAYNSDDAYAVSYSVDPNSAVSRDDILFQQGSTAFADAYSYDLVLDLAEAMKSSALGNQSFIVEGHASAEGSYGANLALSQERAERIARDLVAYGVAADRLVPVGYGEGEAAYPENSPESQRSLDRRVMVFRME